MRYGDFKVVVEDFIGKKGITGKVPTFIKLAKLSIQRRHDFAFTRTSWETTYASAADTGISLPSDFKGFFGDHAVLVEDVPIEASTEIRERQRVFRTARPTYNSDGVITSSGLLTADEVTPVRYYIVRGAKVQKLFTVPEQISQDIEIIYYRWLADYANDSEEDELLAHGFDYFLLETLSVANLYLFEEDRVKIHVGAMEKAFQEFLEWDNAFSNSNAPIDVS